MSARITYLLSQEECDELGHAIYRFSRGVDFRVRVDGEGLDQDEVKRTVRALARRVFSGEIE